MQKLSTKKIVDGKVVIVKNLVPTIFTSDTADGAYLVDNGDTALVTITAVNAVNNAVYEYNIFDTSGNALNETSIGATNASEEVAISKTITNIL